MSDVEIHIDDARVEELLFAPKRGLVVRAVDQVARRVARRARVLAPVRTGWLKASIKATDAHRTGPASAEASVIADTRYATWVHEGTHPHVIRPRKARALRFTAGGQLVFSRKVNHPGSSANHFLTTALEEQKGRDIAL